MKDSIALVGPNLVDRRNIVIWTCELSLLLG
jgi:hypothetical protein